MLHSAALSGTKMQFQGAPGRLAPEQPGELAERLAHASDPEEAATLEKAIMNGFHGMKIDA
jgi:hypothetical protein